MANESGPNGPDRRKDISKLTIDQQEALIMVLSADEENLNKEDKALLGALLAFREIKEKRMKVRKEVENFIGKICYEATIIENNQRPSLIFDSSKDEFEENIKKHVKKEKFNLSQEVYDDVIKKYVERFFEMKDWKYGYIMENWVRFQGAKYGAKVARDKTAKKIYKEINDEIDRLSDDEEIRNEMQGDEYNSVLYDPEDEIVYPEEMH